MRIETPEHLNADNDASRVAREREQFLLIAPTLTRAEFEALCLRRPETWAKFRAEFDNLNR